MKARRSVETIVVRRRAVRVERRQIGEIAQSRIRVPDLCASKPAPKYAGQYAPLAADVARCLDHDRGRFSQVLWGDSF